ncbi:MAG TPA: hypothetical protein VFI76_09835 [Terrimicrobiaceae bacterium]|nr:hypothetical protein [Terrimicrobiaceae bacterium]
MDEMKEQYMNDQEAFELALHRVQNRLRSEGKTVTFRDALKLATAELEQEYERHKSGRYGI